MTNDVFQWNRDVLNGFEFIATLQIRTPLAVLEHHGEHRPGPPSALPNYASIADGIWVPDVKSWDEIARSHGAKPSAYPVVMSSDIGAITPEEYLPFLKRFRRIVESPISVSEKLRMLADFHRSDPALESIWIRLQKQYDDFPNCFFYLQLTTIPGVGSKTARRLFEGGLPDVAAVRGASAETLQAIPGIGPKICKAIREAVS